MPTAARGDGAFGVEEKPSRDAGAAVLERIQECAEFFGGMVAEDRAFHRTGGRGAGQLLAPVLRVEMKIDPADTDLGKGRLDIFADGESNRARGDAMRRQGTFKRQRYRLVDPVALEHAIRKGQGQGPGRSPRMRQRPRSASSASMSPSRASAPWRSRSACQFLAPFGQRAIEIDVGREQPRGRVVVPAARRAPRRRRGQPAARGRGASPGAAAPPRGRPARAPAAPGPRIARR